MAATSIRYIEQQLRRGKSPEELGGKVIGKGAFKAAYLFDSPVGGFVVKLNSQCGVEGNGMQVKTPPKWIRDYGARQPRTYKVGKYLIQEFVTPIRKIKDYDGTVAYKVWDKMNSDERAMRLDMHTGNVGVDANGQLVVFDW